MSFDCNKLKLQTKVNDLPNETFRLTELIESEIQPDDPHFCHSIRTHNLQMQATLTSSLTHDHSFTKKKGKCSSTRVNFAIVRKDTASLLLLTNPKAVECYLLFN